MTRTVAAPDALFFEVKGAVEELLSRFAAGTVTYSGADLPAWIAPGRGAALLLDGKAAGFLGELSNPERERRKLRETAVAAEIDLPALYAYGLHQPLAQEPSRFQAVERDLSFFFPDAVRWADVEGALHSLGIAEMVSLEAVEIYRDPKGKAVVRGEYSLLLRMMFQSHERTLRDEELTRWQDEAIAALVKLGGRHRAV